MGSWAALVLVVHVTYVLFVVAGLALIWIGARLGWRWVRSFWFRVLHLCAIALVALEAILGIACPLTVLEDRLRTGSSTDIGFLQRLMHGVLFWDFPAWAFTAAYLAFAAVVIATFFAIPPSPRKNAAQMKTGRS